ncbi:YqcI/YcgG family protein [Bacillus sp. M6-12]|uniref:YqcI/YcgG family protein n=1 Tax=Bacillus sp. M6-12 TaxID=2054166 RepID=UPI002155254D|nr:YqcI/YcgG family protein [Bacillus sp. M6-12]
MILNSTVEFLEELFWRQLNWVHELDEIDWPADIPADPANPLWEYCFHGERYFMYCATPLHEKRNSRRFPYMMLAITPRWVLQKFTEKNELAGKIKNHIRKRLIQYDSVPPHFNLNEYGNENNHEWKQYFLHDEDTALPQCPFKHLKSRKG